MTLNNIYMIIHFGQCIFERTNIFYWRELQNFLSNNHKWKDKEYICNKKDQSCRISSITTKPLDRICRTTKTTIVVSRPSILKKEKVEISTYNRRTTSTDTLPPNRRVIVTSDGSLVRYTRKSPKEFSDTSPSFYDEDTGLSGIDDGSQPNSLTANSTDTRSDRRTYETTFGPLCSDIHAQVPTGVRYLHRRSNWEVWVTEMCREVD